MNMMLVGLAIGFLHFCLGGLWYSPLVFSRPWMKGLGITQQDIDEARINMTAALGVSALASFAQAACIIWLVVQMEADHLMMGATFGALVATCFCFLPALKDRVWADRSWAVILVDAGYEIVAASMAGALAVWWL